MKTLTRSAALFSLSALLITTAFSQWIFVSQPPTVATVGHLYTYQVRVESMSARAVVDTPFFHLSASAPSGMTIDSVKGLVQWTPKSTGIYGVEIIVTSRLSARVSQSYKLTVVRFTGTISGTVRDTLGHGIPRIFVSLYNNEPKPLNPTVIPIWGVLSAVTDSLGRYTITPIDSGTYYASATSLCNILLVAIPCPYDDYLTVYYKDSPTLAGATPIPIKDANTVQINFVMHKRPMPLSVNIKGTVRDTLGKAIAGANIIVTPMWFTPLLDNGSVGSLVGSAIVSPTNAGGYTDAVASVKTDAEGKYTASVLAGGPYIVECTMDGYLIQFYKLKSNSLEANRLTLSKDTSGVEFRLTPVPKATAKLSGVVHDTSGKGVNSNLVLYGPGPTAVTNFYPTIRVRTVRTDSLGKYVFENVPDGSYILQAIPLHDYLPAYFANNECNTREWKQAVPIIVKGANITGLDICVRKVNVRGAGDIHGRIFASDGSAVDGAVVVAESRTDPTIATYAVSDASGNFDLTSMDPGTYALSTDKVGYIGTDAVTSSVVYGQNAPSQDFLMSANAVTSVGEPDGSELPGMYTLSQNYPNPFNPSTLIEFSMPKSGLATLKVFNVLGQVVRVLINEALEAGVHRVEFTAIGGGQDLPSGTYFYQLTANGNILTKRMMVVK